MKKCKSRAVKTSSVFVFGTAMVLLWSWCLLGARAMAASPVLLTVENPSPYPGAQFGKGVSGTSDIDDDDVPDLIVGASGADTVYLLSGADGTVIRDVGDPEGFAGYEFGFSVANAGDVDGDGIEDFVVGAPALAGGLPIPGGFNCMENPHLPECEAPLGRAYIISGATGNSVWRLESFLYRFGYAVTGLGDVSGDSIPDVAVGAPFLEPSHLGGIFAYSGADGSLLWEIWEPEPIWGGTQPIASFGMFLGVVEDINSDGCHDLLVGAPLHPYGTSASESIAGGKGFVLSGCDGSILREHDNPTPTDNDFFGAGPASLGDLSGDGVGDYAFSEARSGIVHIYDGATGATIGTISNPGSGNPELFGYQIARAGDRDWDGVGELWIGSPDDSFLGDPDGGILYLISGADDTIFEIEDPDTVSYEPSGGFGHRMAVTGDLNFDGAPDLLLGEPARSVNGYAGAGVVYLVLGGFENRLPMADAGPNQTISAGQDCLAAVTLDGSGSYDLDGDELSYKWTVGGQTVTGVLPIVDLPPGFHSIELVVYDGTDYSEPDIVLIDVIDDVPPEVTLVVEEASLWPPNHKMASVGFFEVTDNCSEGLNILVGITSDEPTATAPGAGGKKHAPDASVSSDGNIFVRAERSGLGDGRVYTITVSATDEWGNMCSETGTVQVKFSRKLGAIDSGFDFDATEIN